VLYGRPEKHNPTRPRVILLKYGGEEHLITKWAELLGMPKHMLFSRFCNGHTSYGMQAGVRETEFGAIIYNSRVQSLTEWAE
jgi:hypothetical protein